MRKIYLFLFSIITSLSLMGQEVVKSQLPYAAYKKGMELPTLKSGNLSSRGLTTAFPSASAGQINALLLTADSYAPDVVTTLTATGKFNVVDLLNNVTPTVATLKNYDAVLVWADGSLDDSIGDTLAAYIDGGGGVVSAVFNLYSDFGIEGTRFNTDYLLLNLGDYSSPGTTTLGTVHDASHPIMEGVISLINPNEYRSNNATMTAGSIVVAEWSDGLPLVVVKENVGPSNARRADINIFPPSSNIRGDFWDASTDGGMLLANALLWVSKAGNCPRDMVVDNDPGKCSAVVNFTVNAPEKGSVVQTAGLPSGTEFPVGTITNTFELTDSLGVETTCSFTVTVEDNEAPVVDCPGDIVVYNDPGECGAIVVYSNGTFSGEEILVDEVPTGSLSEWVVTDTGGNPAFTYTEIESPYDGSTAIKTSADGNTYAYCASQQLEKTYNISGNTDVTKLQAYLEFNSTMEYYNFPYVVVELYNDADRIGYQLYYGKGVISGIYANYASSDPDYYTELSGSAGDMILDLSKMGSDIEFNKIKIVLANYACIGQNSIIFDHLRVINGSFDSDTGTTLTASDNCPGVQVEASIPSGSFFPVGITPVTLTATDAAGNETSCTFNITVEDNEAPEAVCGSSGTGKNVLLLWDENNTNTQSLKTAIEAAGFAVTLPAVPEYQWDNTNPPLDDFDAVVHLKGTTWTTPMSIAAQNALVDFVTVQGKAFIHSEWDAYEIDDIHQQDAMSEITILQRYSGVMSDLTYTVVSGMESHPVLKDIPTSFTISSVGFSPSNLRSYASNPAEMLMTDQYGTASVAVRDFGKGKVVGFNHAGNYENSNSLSNANVQQLFINALKWGTNSTGYFEFVLDETGTVTITTDDIDKGSTDNCGIATKELSKTEFNYNDLGTQEVILTITDLSGNLSTCTANITIRGGSEEPVVVANPIEVYLDENGIYYLTPDDLKEMANGTTDDATPFDNLKLTAYPHIFRCNQIGEIIHTRLSVEDAEGNVSRAWTEVTVLDTIPPKAVCRNIEVYLDENGQAEITPEQVMDPASADACGIDTIAVDKNTFSCIDLGENTITLMVTDLSGNMSTCTATVTVHDTLPPVPVEVADVLMEVEPGVCETLIEYPVDVVNDNCGVVLQQTAGLGPNGLFPIGTTVETWIATDNDGNMAEISFSVIVTTGNALPTLNTIGNVSANEDAPHLTVQLAGITYGVDCIEQEVSVTAQADNSELVASVAVEYTGEETGSLTITLAPDMAGTSVVSVKVEDSEGGSVIQSFTLTVNPVNDSPFVVNPIADQVVNASYIIKLPVSSDLGFLFNDPDGDELTVSAMLENGNPIPSWAQIVGDTLVFNPMIADTGCYQIVVKATDPSGAFANNAFKLCVDGYPVSAPLVDGYSFDVKMYPNPTKDMVYLDVNNLEGISDLAVYSITGQEVLRRNFYQNKNISFSMSDFVSGIYLVKINSEGKQIIKKLVVDKH